MKKVNYLKKGEIYEFYQFKVGEKEVIDFHKRSPYSRWNEIKELNSELSLNGGYISIDKDKLIHFWESDNLGVKINQKHLQRYIQGKKSKWGSFPNLKFT